MNAKKCKALRKAAREAAAKTGVEGTHGVLNTRKAAGYDLPVEWNRAAFNRLVACAGGPWLEAALKHLVPRYKQMVVVKPGSFRGIYRTLKRNTRLHERAACA